MILKIFKTQFLILVVCCLLFVASSVGAAKLYLAPSNQTIYQDNSFIVEVKLDTEGEEINTVEANLIYSSNLLEVIDISKGNSILTLWLKEPDIQQKEVSLIGGIPNGFQGEEGLIAKLIFRGKEIGEGIISFKENSKVLLNDGQGTKARLSFLEGSYEIIKRPEGLPVISSKTHPDQNEWYRITSLSLYWDLMEGAEYSWILSRDPLTEPDEIPDKPEPKEGVAFWMGAMEYDLKEEGDGIYYFHLKQKLSDKGWSERITYRTMIDTIPPEEFEPQIGQDPTMYDGKYFLSFVAQDKTSGVDHYEVTEVPWLSFEKTKEWKMVQSSYLLGDQKLRSVIKVKAVDKAGNERVAEIKPPYKITWGDALILLLILIGIGVILWSAKRISAVKKFPISK